MTASGMSEYQADSLVSRDRGGGSGVRTAIAYFCCLLVVWAVFSQAATSKAWVLALFACANALLGLAYVLFARPSRMAVDLLDAFVVLALLHGSAIPLLGVWLGPPDLSYRQSSDNPAAVHAAGVSLAFTAAIYVGIAFAHPSKGMRLRRPGVMVAPQFAWFLIAVGIIGLAIRLPAGPRSLQEVGGPASGPFALLATTCTLLLPVGVYLLLKDDRFTRATRLAIAVALVPLATLAMLSFNLNRGAIIVPLLAMSLTSIRFASNQRLSTLRVVGAVSVCAVIFLYVGAWRQEIAMKEAGVVSATTEPLKNIIVDDSEVYLQSPYLPGVLYEPGASEGFNARSLVASAAAPLPRIGEPFRSDTGTALYNRVIYGPGAAEEDQILPMWAEIERSLGLAAAIGAGFGIGFSLRRLNTRLSSESDTLQFYVLTFAGLWLAQAPILSVSVFSQILIYFILPLFFFSSWQPLLALRRRSPEVRKQKGG